ncbi:MAG TPA: fibronectin type III domain-containing protein, partial [Gemmatimonadales bacterium]|nr:fibronectin type III domain-containing protein [Gemmatimonadales bacterium]
VYRNGNKIAETVGTSYLDTGLSPSTTYSYRVSAVNGQELEGQQSAPASATTLDATGPTKPSNLSAGAVGTDRIDLTWSASADPESGIKEYRVYRDGLQIAVSGQTSYSDTGLAPFTTYQYRVSAVNGQDLESEPSDPASATTRDGTPPTIPQDLVATPVGTGRIDLSWSASTDPESGITGYRVFRDGVEVGETVQTVYQDDGLSAGTSYAYYIVARNGDDLESAPSQIVSAATFDGTGPTTPADLVATATGTGTIELVWSASEDPESGIASYKVFRDGAEIGSTAQTTFQDTGLDPATPYEYRVSAVNGEGLESGLSDPASATTLDGSGPTAPTDLLAEAVSQTRINLSWAASEDPESGIQGYKVYRDNTEVAVVALTEFTDTGLTQGTTYVYSVSAVNGEGIEGARSLSQSATTFPAEDLIPPAPPSGLRLVQP